jgi:dolichol kinase
LVLVPLASWTVLRVTVVAVAIGALVFEIVRLRVPRVRARLAQLVPVYRSHEGRRPSGAMWLSVGYAIATLFPAPAPAAGILVGGLADPAASLVGSHGGGVGQKTLRGSVAHLVVGVAALMALRLPWSTALGLGLLATAVERWSGPLDDNVTVPLVVSAAVTLLA